MVKVLVALLGYPGVIEFLGAVIGIVALFLAWGIAAALGGVSVALLLKSVEMESKRAGRR